LALAFALLALAACSPKPPAETNAQRPAGLQDRFYPPRSWTTARLGALDAPPLRYGVASPTTAIWADVLILPDVGEPAEAWFETANALVAQGYNVWILDLPGPGGSTRSTNPETPQKAPALDPSVVAVNQFVSEIVRPRAPLILLSEGVGAQIGLQAMRMGLPVAGAVLAQPALDDRPVPLPVSPAFARSFGRLLFKLGLGGIGLPGKPPASGGDPERDAAAEAWMRANPQLRPPRPSWAWVAAAQSGAAAARDPAALRRIAPPTTLLGGAEAQAACRAMPKCNYIALPAGPVQRGRDAVRRPWLQAVEAMLKARTEGHAVGAPPVGVKRKQGSRSDIQDEVA
jgi:lysophospholipase